MEAMEGGLWGKTTSLHRRAQVGAEHRDEKAWHIQGTEQRSFTVGMWRGWWENGKSAGWRGKKGLLNCKGSGEAQRV